MRLSEELNTPSVIVEPQPGVYVEVEWSPQYEDVVWKREHGGLAFTDAVQEAVDKAASLNPEEPAVVWGGVGACATATRL